MALTPDDVVTKQFQHVRFKDGFDPDEVDDFLDEIVVEWRKAIAEKDELQAENEKLKAKIAELEASAKVTPSAAAAPVSAAAAAAPAAAPVSAAQAPAPVVAPSTPAPTSSGQSLPTTATASIIELAQRLHDEHVAEGESKAKKIVSEAEDKAKKTISDAEKRRLEETARLERERNTLEGRITQLREFERDYRSKLKSYIEGQLQDLEAKTTVQSGETPVAAIGL